MYAKINSFKGYLISKTQNVLERAKHKPPAKTWNVLQTANKNVHQKNAKLNWYEKYNTRQNLNNRQNTNRNQKQTAW